MTAPAHTYQRQIEEAVVTLLKADTDYGINQTYQDGQDVDYSASIVRAYGFSTKVPRLSILVECRDLTNAMLGSTGRGSLWNVMLKLRVSHSIADDKDDENADRVQGACERWLAAVTTATLNTALTGSGITIHGITAAQDPDEMDQAEGALRRTSVVTLHFGV
jgi:hypothetical protein